MIRQLSGPHTWVVKFIPPAFWLAAAVVPLALLKRIALGGGQPSPLEFR